MSFGYSNPYSSNNGGGGNANSNSSGSPYSYFPASSSSPAASNNTTNNTNGGPSVFSGGSRRSNIVVSSGGGGGYDSNTNYGVSASALGTASSAASDPFDDFFNDRRQPSSTNTNGNGNARQHSTGYSTSAQLSLFDNQLSTPSLPPPARSGSSSNTAHHDNNNINHAQYNNNNHYSNNNNSNNSNAMTAAHHTKSTTAAAASSSLALSPSSLVTSSSATFYDHKPSFTPIEALGIRHRTSQVSATSSSSMVTTADLIVNFKMVLSAPPDRNPTTNEVEVKIDLQSVKEALLLSKSDGGLCKGVRPCGYSVSASSSSSNGSSPSHSDDRGSSMSSAAARFTSFWVAPVRGMKFVEYDLEVSAQHTTNNNSAPVSPNPQSPNNRNIRFHVMRGTLVGYFGDASASTSDPFEPTPGRLVLWQPRGHTVCSVLDLSRCRPLTAIRCKHCQAIVPSDESSYHLMVAHPDRAAAKSGGNSNPSSFTSGNPNSPPPPTQSLQRPVGNYDPFALDHHGGGGGPRAASNANTTNATPRIGPSASGVPLGRSSPFPQVLSPSSSAPSSGILAHGGGTGGTASGGGSFGAGGGGTFSRNPSVQSAAGGGGGGSSPALPFGATQGSTYSTYYAGANSASNNGSPSGARVGSLADQQRMGGGSDNGGSHFFGSPTAAAEAASAINPARRAGTGTATSSVRSYMVQKSVDGRPVYVNRQSREIFGEHYQRFQFLIRGHKLGEGAQGVVSLCDTPEGHKLVVKDIGFERQEDAVACFQKSMGFNQLKHVHLICYLAGEWGYQEGGASSSSSSSSPSSSSSSTCYYVSILMPFYPDGDIAKLIQQGQRLSWYAISSLGLQIASALVYLHKLTPHSMIHGDIKPDNILLYSNKEQCVLMDLDTARECEVRSSVYSPMRGGGGGGGGSNSNNGFSFDNFLSGNNRVGGPSSSGNNGNGGDNKNKADPVGTMEWMSPEVAEHRPATTTADVWSLGLVLFAMCTLPDFMMFENPVTRQTCVLNDSDWTAEALKTVISRHLERSQCPRALSAVILKMVVLNPRLRLTSSEVVVELQNASERLLLGEG